jgi:colicin import membrane protein
MKKLFAALATVAFAGTVFAQTGAPAAASATPSKSEPAQAQASVHKDKTDVQSGAHKSAAKGTHHKAKATPDTTKSAGATGTASPAAGAAKTATPDNSKKQ